MKNEIKRFKSGGAVRFGSYEKAEMTVDTCPVCGQEPGFAKRCCSECGATCNLQYGCGSTDCRTTEPKIPAGSSRFAGNGNNVLYRSPDGEWYIDEQVCLSADLFGGTCRCNNHPATWVSYIGKTLPPQLAEEFEVGG